MPTPIHWWRLNENAGTAAADSIGSATGAYVGVPLLGEAESPSTDPDVLSVLLDGVDDYIDLLSGSTASGVTMPMTAGTLMAWFRPPQDNINPGHDTSGDQEGILFYIGDGTGFIWLAYEYKDEDPFPDFGTGEEVKRFQLASTADGISGDQLYHDLDKTDNNNDWYHLAVTWEDSGVNLYVYGPIDAASPTTAQITGASTYTWPSNNATTVRAGTDAALTSIYWMRGHLCDIKLYDDVLSLPDINSERDRRSYAAPTVPTASGTTSGLAKAMQYAAGTFQQIVWSKGGAPLDLTDAVLTGTIKPRFGITRPITGTLTVAADPTTGAFVWAYSGSDVQNAGELQVQFTASYPGRTEYTLMAPWIVEMTL